MNYLAHLYLADDTVESQLGNFLGDFLKGVDREQFPEEIQRGISVHLAIDAFTDAHPIFKRSRDRLSADRRRFAGIIVDVFYDHFLAQHWNQYAEETLEEFSQRVVGGMLSYTGFVPDKARYVLERLNENERLQSYRNIDSIGYVLDGLAYRFPRENPMGGSVEELHDAYEDFEEDFFMFFPEIQAHVRSLDF